MARTDYRKIYEQFFEIKWDRNAYEIHDIDHDRTNNSINNLILLPRELHHRLHIYQQLYIPIYYDKTLKEVIRELESYHCSGLQIFIEENITAFIDTLNEITYWGYLKSVEYRCGIGAIGGVPDLVNIEGIWSAK